MRACALGEARRSAGVAPLLGLWGSCACDGHGCESALHFTGGGGDPSRGRGVWGTPRLPTPSQQVHFGRCGEAETAASADGATAGLQARSGFDYGGARQRVLRERGLGAAVVVATRRGGQGDLAADQGRGEGGLRLLPEAVQASSDQGRLGRRAVGARRAGQARRAGGVRAGGAVRLPQPGVRGAPRGEAALRARPAGAQRADHRAYLPVRDGQRVALFAPSRDVVALEQCFGSLSPPIRHT